MKLFNRRRRRLMAILTVLMLVSVTVTSAQGGTISVGSHNFLSTELFFEPEKPFVSLKEEPPTWNEIEQLLDNPYGVAVNTTTATPCSDAAGLIPGNDWMDGLNYLNSPSYCTNGTFIRRPSFLPGGAALPHMLVHPLNYNPSAVGNEMRLINPRYPGGTFNNTSVCYGTTTTGCTPTPSTITVSPGASRVAPGDAEIDYNEKYARDTTIHCEPNPEPVPLASPSDPTTTMENFIACGGDPGEPGYVGYGRFGPPLGANIFSSYSTPAVPGVLSPGTPIPASARLFAPTRNGPEAIAGVIPPRNIVAGTWGLRKPSLRVATVGGDGLNPNYLWNSAVAATVTRPDPTGADLQPSNENDYVGLYSPTGVTPTNANYMALKQAARLEAMRLGKSLFWDMQVGSDAVQSCGSCHAHAGADNRTKNQMNPNDIGGDLMFDIGQITPTLQGANHDLVASDFPFHKLFDPEVAGDPNCTPAIYADVRGIQFPDGDPPAHPLPTTGPDGKTAGHFKVCDAANIANPRSIDPATGFKNTQNDVASSMGVHFGRFYDIPPIGSFGTPSAIGGVVSVLPDLRSPVAADNVDPIPGFAGIGSGSVVTTTPPAAGSNQFRRVEPRNTPTIFLADYNFDNFWDGRARHDDNGGSVFGPSDPQSHVMVDNNGTIVPTRQIIKFSSLASLAKGPALSQFEMSFNGRNWAKIGKKLLQAGVTPLANQLVDPTDSILGPYSNQNGSACASLPASDRSPAGLTPTTLGVGVPGLCISYPALIRHAFYPALHRNTSQHLNGCYTDGRADIHPNQCVGLGPIPILNDPFGSPSLNTTNTADPFDGYRLTPASGAATATDTNQFTQMEANFSLFWGQSIHVWATILVPDDTPWDQWLDQNPDAHENIGETGEPLLVNDLVTCGQSGPLGTTLSGRRFFDTATGRFHAGCFTEVGHFKRDPGLTGCLNNVLVPGVGRQCNQTFTSTGTRLPGDPDPLLGMDIFFGSNLSLKNPEFRSARCGECHAPPTLTDHTVSFTHKWTLGDVLPEFEFGAPDIEPLLEPMGRERIISGFLLEEETSAPGQDAIERRTINMSIAPAPVSTNVNCVVDNCSGYSFPDGITNNHQGGYTIHSDIGNVTQGPLVGDNTPVPFTSFGGAFFDNGVYNLGVTQCDADQVMVIGRCDDNGRGNTDAFGWPLSFAALLMKNLGGPGQQPGVPIAQFDPIKDDGGLWEKTAQDQQINPGYTDDQVTRLLPPYLAPFPPKIPVGDEQPGVDEAGMPFGGMVNTLMDVANAEGFPEFPVDPQPYIGEVINSAKATVNGTLGGSGLAHMGTWPMVNRVGRFGSFKAPQLREVGLTGPYFHNGGKLTLRQVIDFYTRGGDYPVVNAAHRDFLIINLNADLQANLNEAEKVALVDFLLELTDNRVAFEKGPFDHPEEILPLDGTAPENTFGHDGFLAGGCTPASQFGPGQQSCNGGMFLDVPASGTAGTANRLPNFLGVTDDRGTDGTSGFNCDPTKGPISQYCH